MEVTKPWSGNDINKYYIITRDKETNEWKFFKEIVGHTVLWKDEPSRYGMTKSRAIEVLNIVKNLTNEDVKPEPIEPENPTEPIEPTEGTNPTDGEPTEPTTPTDTEPTNTDPTDTPTEPSENNNDTPTNTDEETPTGENNNGETSSEGNTEPNNGNETNTEPTDPVTPTEEPTIPTTPTEPQYKIITISTVTYNSTEVAIFDDDDYNKLKSTLIYIDSTYPNTNVHVVTVETDTGKSIFYFYLEDELTWFLELRTNIDYSLVNHVTTLDDIRGLL